MATPTFYDLLVLLDPEAPEERRTQLVQQIKGRIDGGGATLKGDIDWGMRRLAYEIDHRREAQYHLFQFTAEPDVLSQLDRSLSIDDSVLRHRIIRVHGEPPETPPRPTDDAVRRPSDERPAEAAPASEQPAPATEVPAAETTAAEAPAAETPAPDTAPTEAAPSEAAAPEPPATEAAPEPPAPEAAPEPPDPAPEPPEPESQGPPAASPEST